MAVEICQELCTLDTKTGGLVWFRCHVPSVMRRRLIITETVTETICSGAPERDERFSMVSAAGPLVQPSLH